jgi:uncharacterized iron-regulated membrane protein
MDQAWWRRWHRWIGFVGGVFLCFASITGVLVAVSEFFGEAEALREATRDVTSPVTTSSEAVQWETPARLAMARAAQVAPGAPIDKIVLQFKGTTPTVDVFLGKPGGGEDRRFVIAAATGELLRTETYADKPLLNRIHSGEFFGDGGLVAAMLWGAALTWLSVSGLFVYFKMRRRNPAGFQRLFW